jgi:terminase small subunit-like protein
MAKAQKGNKKVAKKIDGSSSVKTKEKNKGGRPPLFTQELADKICRIVATSTDGIRKICRLNPGFPSHTVVHEWRLDYPAFADQYATAKRNQAELLAEEIMDISNDDSQDLMHTETGTKFNSEFVARSRLKVDSRKWIACKLLPKIYGDKSEVTTNSVADEQLKATLSKLQSAVDLITKHERDY